MIGKYYYFRGAYHRILHCASSTDHKNHVTNAEVPHSRKSWAQKRNVHFPPTPTPLHWQQHVTQFTHAKFLKGKGRKTKPNIKKGENTWNWSLCWAFSKQIWSYKKIGVKVFFSTSSSSTFCILSNVQNISVEHFSSSFFFF